MELEVSARRGQPVGLFGQARGILATASVAALAACVGGLDANPVQGVEVDDVDQGQDCLRLKEGSPYYEGVPGAGVNWLVLPPQQANEDAGWGDALTDIAQHLPAEYGDVYWDEDPITHGHETSHGIHAHLRNRLNDTGGRANGFYGLSDRAALVLEPAIRKSDVARFIPGALRGPRYDLYVTGSRDWDDTPLYLWDEWVAYTNGGAVAVDQFESGLWQRDWRDGVAGQLEFTVYALAVARAVEELDPDYFREGVQFREFLAWNTERAMRIYRAGAVLEAFAWDRQDRYHRELVEGDGGAEIRAFARRLFGRDWADRELLGLEVDGAPPPDPDPDPDPGPEPPVPDPDPAPAPELPPKPPVEPDSDGDGVPDSQDLCGSTSPQRPVHPVGPWTGCADGERRDADLAAAQGDCD